MDQIRVIKDQDYPMLALFWALSGSYIDPEAIYPRETSYVFERDGQILYAVAVHQVRGLPIAYVEAVIRNPHKRPDFEALKSLQEYLEAINKAQGYKQIVGIPKNEKLAEHYERLGYNRVGSVIYAIKEL